MIEMIVGVVFPGVVTDPLAVFVNVRRVGMSRRIAIVLRGGMLRSGMYCRFRGLWTMRRRRVPRGGLRVLAAGSTCDDHR
jgi:hypothetical protein